MVQILRATVFCKSGRVIVQRYAEIANKIGVYLSSDLEKSRKDIEDFHARVYGPIDHINLAYTEVKE